MTLVATRTPSHRQWRARKEAIGRKFGMEAPDEESFESTKPKTPAIVDPESPKSIFSVGFEEEYAMKPMVLPEAWTLVGKGGKPVLKYWYAPIPKVKRKRIRVKHVPEFDDHPLMELEMSRMPAPHVSHKLHEGSDKARTKIVLKHWQRVRRAKAEARVAAELHAISLEASDAPVDSKRFENLCKARNNKKDSVREKMRRKARFASSAAKCWTAG